MMLPVSLDMIQQENRECYSCKLRCVDEPVCGIGPSNAQIFIIGEYPSSDEALIGRPFEERSGQMLKKLMKEADLDYHDTYMTYVLRCNGPILENNPLVDVCKKWLWKELQCVDPKIIVTLGKVPTRLLLKPKANFTIRDMAGKFYTVDFLPKAKIVPWYSTAMMVQRGNWFRTQTTNFFKKIIKELDR